jgi:DNA-binding CsgD family transcriptional regulator
MRRWAPPRQVTPDRTARITPRQADILSCLAVGMTNRQIAQRFYITEHTVKTHIKRLFRSLRCSNRCEAVAWTLCNRVAVEIVCDEG